MFKDSISESYDFFTIINLIITGLVTLIFIVFLLTTLLHIITNVISSKRKLIIHWLDYILNLISIIIFNFVYIKWMYFVYKAPDKRAVLVCQNYFWCMWINCHYFLISWLYLSNVFLNLLNSIGLIIKIKKILKIKATKQCNLVQEITDLKISKTTDTFTYLIEFIIVQVVVLSILTKLILNIKDRNIEAIKNGQYILIASNIFILVFDGFMIYLFQSYKEDLLNNNFYHNDMVMLAIYNIASSKVIFYSDFITFKSIIDFITDFGPLLVWMIENISLYALYVHYFIWISYFYFMGITLLHVDKTNKLKVGNFVMKVFGFGKINLNFGEKEKAKLFDNYLLDLNKDESTLIGDLNLE